MRGQCFFQAPGRPPTSGGGKGSGRLGLAVPTEESAGQMFIVTPNVKTSYMRDDGRVEVATFDWSEDVQVTNNTACVRLNIAAV